MKIRNLKEDDIHEIRNFVNLCKPLGLHTAFTYWVLAKYFNNICFVAEDQNAIAGLLTSIKCSVNDNLIYLWQIGISPQHRRKQYASLLVKKLVDSAIQIGVKHIQFSIADENIASYEMFSGFAEENGLTMRKIDKLYFNDSLTDTSEFEHIYEYVITK